MKTVDLHTHSTASDGTLSPRELIRYAKEKGLSAVALTDHDTADGLEEAAAAGRETGVEVIPGIEITTIVDGCDVHLIGLYLDLYQPDMARLLAEMARCRRERNHRIVARLAAAGVEIGEEDFRELGDRAVTRGHIGAVLIRRGYAATLREAIDRYMAKGRPGYVLRETPAPKTCIDAVHRAGGLAFVAHTNQIDREDPAHSLAVCRRMLEAGADGLETKYCEYDAFWEEQTEAVAREYGCLRSGGSDFHGAIKKGLDLGTGYGGLAVPYAFLEAIKAAHGAAQAAFASRGDAEREENV